MEHYISTTEEFEDYSIERVFTTDQLSLELWMVRMSQELREAGGPVLYGVGVGGSILARPIIHKGIIYFGCCDKNMYAVTLDGEEVWRFATGGVLYDAALHKDILYFGSFDGNFYAVDLNGRLKWKFACTDKIGSRPLIYKDTIYFGSKDKNFYALTLDGKLKWMFPTAFSLQTISAACKDRIYFSSIAGGKFFCVDTEGNLKWEFDAGEACSPGSIHKDTVFFSSLNENLYALTLDGTLKWKRHVSAPTLEDIIIHNNRLFMVDFKNNVLCLDLKGRLVWKFVTKDIMYARPIFHDGKLYIGSTDMNFYCLDEKTGKLLWKFASGGPITNVAARSGNKIVYGGYDCKLYCITTDGEVLWKFPTSLSYISQVNIPPKPQQQTFQVIVPPEEPVTTEEKYKGKTEEWGGDFSGSVYTGLDVGYAGGSVYTDKKKQRYK